MQSTAREEIAYHLDLVWNRIPASGSGDFDLPDVIAFVDVANEWSLFKSELVDSISDKTYYPDPVEIVDLPKGTLAVRPLARMSLRDRLVYEACIFAMASAIDAAVPRSVYSYRWWRRKENILHWFVSWRQMKRRAKFLHKRHPSFLLAKTDVTSFYEYVDIDILFDDIRSLPVPSWAIETLERFLRAFNSLNQAWGIPQSSDASGLLANLYLLPVDKEIASGGFEYIRYSDDISLFGPDWLELRRMLLQINRILRTRRLSVAASKTKIIPSHKIAQEFEDAAKDAINYGLDVAPESSLPELHNLFDAALKRDPVDITDFRYCLTKLRKHDDPYAVDWLIQNMGEIPHLAKESLRYLDAFARQRTDLSGAIVDLLVNSKLSIYPYAEQHVLAFMIRHKMTSARANEEAWKILRDRNKETYVREFAARYIGRNPVAGDGGRLKQEFQSEQNGRVRRALLVACYEVGHCSESWLNVVVSAGSEVARTGRYLQTGPMDVPVPWTELSIND